MMGFFIALEGGEGVGKSTQAKYLYGLLSRERYRVTHVREPGATALGEFLRILVSMPRNIVLANAISRYSYKRAPSLLFTDTQILAKELWLNITPEAELFLFAAARAQLISDVIRPILGKGDRKDVIICERYIYSTLAYQGYGRGLDLDFVSQICKVATGGLLPDMVILLDIDPADGRDRKRGSTEVSRFEEEKLDFHKRVRQGYLELAKQDLDRFYTVNASLPRKKVSEMLLDKVLSILQSRGLHPPYIKNGRDNKSMETGRQGSLVEAPLE